MEEQPQEKKDESIIEESKPKEEEKPTYDEVWEENKRLGQKLEDSIPKKIAAFEVVKHLKAFKKTIFLSVLGLIVTVIATIFGMKMGSWSDVLKHTPGAVMAGIFSASLLLNVFKIIKTQSYLEEQYDLKPEKDDKDEDTF